MSDNARIARPHCETVGIGHLLTVTENSHGEEAVPHSSVATQVTVIPGDDGGSVNGNPSLRVQVTLHVPHRSVHVGGTKVSGSQSGASIIGAGHADRTGGRVSTISMCCTHSCVLPAPVAVVVPPSEPVNVFSTVNFGGGLTPAVGPGRQL
jgi:hypothetical protein